MVDNMHLTENKKLMNNFLGLVNKKKINKAFKILSEKMNLWILGNILVSGNYNKRKISVGLKVLHRRLDNFKFILGQITGEENHMTVMLESKAKSKSNGKLYNYHFLISIDKRKICDVKESFDTIQSLWIENFDEKILRVRYKNEL
jgi:hypothetical protein